MLLGNLHLSYLGNHHASYNWDISTDPTCEFNTCRKSGKSPPILYGESTPLIYLGNLRLSYVINQHLSYNCELSNCPIWEIPHITGKSPFLIYEKSTLCMKGGHFQLSV